MDMELSILNIAKVSNNEASNKFCDPQPFRLRSQFFLVLDLCDVIESESF